MSFERGIIFHPRDIIAAKEVRRYVYLTTGSLPNFIRNFHILTGHREIIVITAPGTPLLHSVIDTLKALDSDSASSIEEVLRHMHHPESFSLCQFASKHGLLTVTLLLGSGATGRLYAAYTLAEQLGVHFGLHADVLPDPTAAGGLPLASHSSAPLPLARTCADGRVYAPGFDIRGLQPFHDFPEGPDWWAPEQYQHVVSQLAKMKMNFIGLHTYPYSAQPNLTGHNEPTMWVGTKDHLRPDGTIRPSGAY